jgi:hypothetical protein
LAIFVLSAVFSDEYSTFIYRGGMFLLSLNTAVLIICISHPSSLLGNLLSWKPLRWIGTRSYGIYLWHYPIMVLSTPVYEIGSQSYWRVGLQLTAACIMAELSYRLIEVPVRKYGLRGFYSRYLSLNIFHWRQFTLAKKISTATAAILILVFALGIANLANEERMSGETKACTTEIMARGTDKAVITKENKPSSPQNNTSNYFNNNGISYSKKNDKKSPVAIKPNKQVLAIGDSIMLDIADDLKKNYTNIKVDGKIGRQMKEAIKLANTYSAFENADKAVVIELGTNGYFTGRQIDHLLNSFSKAYIYLVNTRVPRTWEKRVNKILKEKAEERKNVKLVDWYSVAIKHPEYFDDDGVHLKPAGSDVLAKLIVKALNSN